jgi:hypothetical protein
VLDSIELQVVPEDASNAADLLLCKEPRSLRLSCYLRPGSIIDPILAVGRDFFLPDRDGFLERVDRVAAGFEESESRR